jgi:hypothetical protein
MKTNRRNLLKTAAALSAPGGLLAMLQGCSANTKETQISDDLQIHIPQGLQQSTLLAQIGGLSYPLTTHTPESRALARAQNPALDNVQDARLSHYVKGAPFSPNAQSFRLLSVNAQGLTSFVGGGIHLPPTEQKTRAYDLDRKLLGQSVSDGQAAQITDSMDSAIWHVFHHPKLMTLSVDTSQRVLGYIKSSASFAGLVAFIDAHPAGSAQAYVSSRQILDAQGQPIVLKDTKGQVLLNPDGSPRTTYSINLSAPAQKWVSQVVSETTLQINNDPSFENIKHSTIVNEGNARSNNPSSVKFKRLGDEGAELELEGDGRFVDGVQLSASEYDAGTRTLTLEIENRRFEHVALYASFEDQNGNLQKLDSLGIEKNFADSDLMQLLTLVNPFETFFAIPIEPGEEKTTVTIPTQSRGVRLWVTKFAISDGPDYLPELNPKVVLAPMLFTLLFELIIPTLMLVSGGVEVTKVTYQKFIKDSEEELRKEAVIELVEALLKVSVDGNSASLIDTFTGSLMPNLLKEAPTFMAKMYVQVALAEGVSASEQIIPIAGQIFLAASAAASAIEILESLGSFLTGTRYSARSLRVVNTAELTLVAPDLGFPPALSEARITVLLAGRTQPYYFTQPITTPSGNTLRLSTGKFLAGVPATFEVELYSQATDEILSRGQVILDSPVSPTKALEGEVEMQSKPLSLTNTEPQPFAALSVQRTPAPLLSWVPNTTPAGSAPICTQYDTPGVCKTFGISVSNGSRRVGVSSLGMGPRACQSATLPNPLLMTLALPVNATDPADGGKNQLMFYDGGVQRGSLAPSEGGCQDRPMHLALDLVGNENADHFVLLPNVTLGGYNARKISLTPGAMPDNLANAPLIGRFRSNNIRHVRWHPKGYLVAVSADLACLEILPTNTQVKAGQTQIPIATTLVGSGDSALKNPTCVAPIRNANLFLVLDGNRIVCMDDQGALVRFFNNQQSYFQIFNPSPQWIDVDTQGVLYTMSPTGSVNALNLNNGNFYFNTALGTINQFAVDYWRSIYTTESQIAGFWNGAISVPQVRVWRPVRS